MQKELEFTGNWFIDLGILGFVNLMEEVYGWDLERLNKEILSEKEIVFYGLFPVAYFKNWLLVRGYKGSGVEIVYEEMINRLKQFKAEQQIFNEVWWSYITSMFKEAWVESVIKKLLDKNQMYEKWRDLLETSHFISISNFVESLERLINSHGNDPDFKNLLGKKQEVKSLKIDDLRKIENYCNSTDREDLLDKDLSSFFKSLQELKKSLREHWENLPQKAIKINDKSRILFRLPIDHGFFKNFMFFNQNKNIWEQKELMYKLVKFDIDENSLQKIDKTVNKLFPSDKEFSNEAYTQFSTRNFENMDKLFVFLLCFPEAFNRVGGINIAFYSNSLEFSYKVNKRIKVVLNREDVKDNSILNFTWRQIIDTLWEYKASWALENMYLIQYRKLDNQSQQDVEYLGISKLQAEFIIDDKIRETLNQKIKVLEKGDRQYQWLLQEFIKNRPLLPIFYRNLRLYFSSKDSQKRRGGDFKNTNALIYAAALDKVIADLGIEKTNLFSNDFFHKSKSVLKETKDTIQRYFSLMFAIRELFSQESVDNKNSLAYRLFSRLKRKQKYPFVNELLKELNRKDNKDEVEPLIKHLFENILANDKTWQSEAIPIIAGLIKGGVNNEE